MAPLLLAVTLTLAPPTIAVPGLNGVRLAPGEADLYAELLSNEMTKGGLKVFTTRDVQQMLGVERQKELLGCSEGSSCVVEMVGALGVDGVLMGDIGALGDEYVLNFKVLSAKSGTTIALYNARAANVKALPDELERAARSMLHQLAVAFARPDLEPKVPPAGAQTVTTTSSRSGGGSDKRIYALVPGIIGVVAGVVGVALRLLAEGALSDLNNATNVNDVEAAYTRGKGFETGGWVGIGIGIAGLGTAAIIALLGKPPPVEPAVMVGPGMGGFALGGRFP
jgi:hypothetical protein